MCQFPANPEKRHHFRQSTLFVFTRCKFLNQFTTKNRFWDLFLICCSEQRTQDSRGNTCPSQAEDARTSLTRHLQPALLPQPDRPTRTSAPRRSQGYFSADQAPAFWKQWSQGKCAHSVLFVCCFWYHQAQAVQSAAARLLPTRTRSFFPSFPSGLTAS